MGATRVPSPPIPHITPLSFSTSRALPTPPTSGSQQSAPLRWARPRIAFLPRPIFSYYPHLSCFINRSISPSLTSGSSAGGALTLDGTARQMTAAGRTSVRASKANGPIDSIRFRPQPRDPRFQVKRFLSAFEGTTVPLPSVLWGKFFGESMFPWSRFRFLAVPRVCGCVVAQRCGMGKVQQHTAPLARCPALLPTSRTGSFPSSWSSFAGAPCACRSVSVAATSLYFLQLKNKYPAKVLC